MNIVRGNTCHAASQSITTHWWFIHFSYTKLPYNAFVAEYTEWYQNTKGVNEFTLYKLTLSYLAFLLIQPSVPMLFLCYVSQANEILWQPGDCVPVRQPTVPPGEFCSLDAGEIRDHWFLLSHSHESCRIISSSCPRAIASIWHPVPWDPRPTWSTKLSAVPALHFMNLIDV